MIQITFVFYYYRISAVIVSVFASSAVNRGFEPRLDQTKAIKLIFVTAINAMYVRSNKTCTNITTQSSSPTIVGM
jgi:hypothetical protein